MLGRFSYFQSIMSKIHAAMTPPTLTRLGASGEISGAVVYTPTHGKPGIIRDPRGVIVTTTKLAAFLLLSAVVCGTDGRKVFRDRCAGCHGSDARGTGKGPGLAGNPRLSGQSVEQLRAVAQRGFPNSGMPAFDLPPEELDAVASYVRSLNAGMTVGPPGGKRVTWGKPHAGDWLTYNGKFSANRYSELKQIHTGNVGALRLQWIFPIPYLG